MSGIKTVFYKSLQAVSKNAPLLLTGAGIIGLGGTAYLSFKSSKRINEIITERERYNEAMENVTVALHRKELVTSPDAERLSDAEYEEVENALVVANEELQLVQPMEKKDYLKQLAAASALPLLTGVASIGCILASYFMLNNRLLNTAAALATSLAEGEYIRNKTKEVYGEEGINKIYNAPVTTTPVTTTNDKGKEVTNDEDIINTVASLHGVWFKESGQYVSDDNAYNLQYIDMVREKLINRQFMRGYLTLNDVYQALDIPVTRGGATVGWAGDNFDLYTDEVLVYDPKEKIRKPEIYVKWTTPKDVLYAIEYEGRYSIAGI